MKFTRAIAYYICSIFLVLTLANGVFGQEEDGCALLKDCVQCRVHKTGKFFTEDNCEQQCISHPQPELVDVASVQDGSLPTFCEYTDDSDDCKFYFVYGHDEAAKLYIKAQLVKDCPAQPPRVWILMAAGAGLLIVVKFIRSLSTKRNNKRK